METCTWNVIFMSMDVSYQDNANSRFLSKVIQLGANFFIKDVEDSTFNERLKITVFNLKSDGEVGQADVFKNVPTKPSNKNALVKKYHIENFDCLKNDSYEKFLKNELIDIVDKENQKIILIFLAHSFGAGFFFKPKDDQLTNIDPLKVEYEYFTTVQLHDSINAALNPIETLDPKALDPIKKGRKKPVKEPAPKPTKKLDCLIALNCWLQSVETNIVFGDITNYLISSQQPLEITELSYKKLFEDLLYTSEIASNGQESLKISLSDEIVFSKFLYNCYQVYKSRLNKETRPIDKLDDFSLSLTKPPKAEAFNKAIKLFWPTVFEDTKNKPRELGKRNVDFWSYAAHFCADPSYIQSVNIIDATQFFLKLKTFYPIGSPIEITINGMLDALRNMIVLNVSSPYMCSTNVDAYNLMTTYLPFGIGIFIPKILSVNLQEIVWIFASGNNKAPRPIDNFFKELISHIANFHKGNIPYDQRNKLLHGLFDL